MMRIGRAASEGGAGKPMTFREGLKNLRSEVSSLKSTGSRALSSVKESVGKIYVDVGKKLGKNPSMISKGFTFGDDAITLYNERNLIPKEGWDSVVIHGSKKGNKFSIGERKLTAQDLADKMIKEGYKEGTPIRLISCHSGRSCTGGAAQLSEILKTQVEAPTVGVETLKNGSFKLHKYKDVERKWVTYENGQKIGERK
jgi:hypothetical protein